MLNFRAVFYICRSGVYWWVLYCDEPCYHNPPRVLKFESLFVFVELEMESKLFLETVEV